MKTLLFLLFILVSTYSFPQDIIGDWYGKLSLPGMDMRIIFHITKLEDEYQSTLDSPDQGAFGIKTNSTIFNGQHLIIDIAALGATYKGTLSENSFIGTFSQGGLELELDLSKTVIEKKGFIRPQEPSPTDKYSSQEVEIENRKDSLTLSGTLTIPKGKGPFAVAILISGSGPQDRNEEILGHKPFWVIADYLTRQGIAVLRYDDRGTANSTGDFKNSTSLDFANDVEAVIEFLRTQKKIDPNRIGLIGHSEGGLIAPMVAAKPENNIAFSILMAGPGIRGSELILKQQSLISRANGTPEKEILKDEEWTKKMFRFMESNLNSKTFDEDAKLFIDSLNNAMEIETPSGMTKDELSATLYNSFCDPWMKYFLFLDPAIALRQIKCPVLAINGSMDLQVPPKENLSAIKTNIESNGNKAVTIKEFPKLNHLFQVCTTGSPNEYARIEQTISPEVLEIMGNWIKENIGSK